MIDSVLFDFDGVIVDSERLHWAAFNVILEPLGCPILWPDYTEVYMGFDDRDAFRHALPQIDEQQLSAYIVQKAVAFQDLLAAGGAAALPGAVDLIKHLSARLPIAICSGALREDIDPIVKQLGVENEFQTIVTAEDTPRSKPDPAPYQLTAKRLKTVTGLAIEDTPAGITSAKGANLFVLGVTNSYPADVLTDADAVVDTLEGLTLEKLNELISQRQK